MRDLDVPPPNLSVVRAGLDVAAWACWRWRRHDMALISSERSSKKSSSLRSRIAIKIFLCKLMKAAAAAGGDGAAVGTEVEATARAEGQMLDSMEHACQLQISTSPSPIAVVQKAVRIFNWKAQKSKKRE